MQTVEKLPPHNLEAEESVLGSLLLDRDAVIRVAASLKPEDFYRASHAAVYRAILDLYNRREPADLLTVAAELERREELEERLVEELADVADLRRGGRRAQNRD